MKKIYVSHARDFDFQNELYMPLKTCELGETYDFFFPHESNASLHTRDIIKEANIVLAEVSYPSVGQGIELGWADMMHVPIVCVSREDAKISSSLTYISEVFLTYATQEEFISKLSDFLNRPQPN